MKASILMFLAFICLAASSNSSQSTSLQKALYDKANFTEAEMSEVETGRPVVKVLETQDKREVSVLGIIKLPRIVQLDAASFREGLSQRGGKVILESGAFSRPPRLEDLEELEVDAKDIEDLGKCVVGNCNVKLSAEMIRRFNTQIDWNAPDPTARVKELYKVLLAEAVQAYSEKGDKALIEYVDQRKPVDLKKVYPSLLKRSYFIKEFAPELETHLNDYPHQLNDSIEDQLEWSQVRSGLKPIITATHGSTFSKQADDGNRIALVTKQIYASHYIDALLALSTVITTRHNGQEVSYLLFTNITYSESLGGALGRLVRSVVEREAVEKVTDLLQRGSFQLGAADRPSPSSEGDLFGNEDKTWWDYFTRYWLFLAAGAVVLILIIYLIRRRP